MRFSRYEIRLVRAVARCRHLRRAAAGALASTLLSACVATAAEVPAVADARSSTELVKPGLYRVNGDGAGAVVRVGSKSLFVVDSKAAGAYPALIAELGRLAPVPGAPVRALALTAVGAEQAGNVAAFASAGVPVLVQRRALSRLVDELRARGAAAPKNLIVYDTDYMLPMDDVVVEIEHVGHGRTGADSVVFFRDLRVMAVGELYTHGTPVPDCASGGSYAGWAAAIAHILQHSFDVAVPSRGAPVGKAELAAFKDKLRALAAHAATSPTAAACPPTR